MVQFGTGYFMPMDRDYENPAHGALASTSPANSSTNDVGVKIGDLGMSIGLGPVPNVHSIGAKMHAGTKTMELTFMGAGKGSGQGHTPEYYGKMQRQALREMQKANEYNFTTHASVGIMGLAGMTQEGNFSKEHQNFSLQEIKRAVEFAADVTNGGAVVVHTGEFHRPLVDADWNQKDERWKDKFQRFAGEEEKSTFRVIDNRYGGLIQEARKNRRITKPIWKRYNEGDDYWKEHGGEEYTDEKGNIVRLNDYIDDLGNKVESNLRVPVFDAQAGHFKTTQMDWNDLVQEAGELTERARKFWRENKEKPREVWEKDLWPRFSQAQSEKEIVVRPEEAYVIASMETNAAHARGWALQYGGTFDELVETYKKLRKAKDFHKKIEDTTDPQEQWKLKRQFKESFSDLIPPKEEFPSDFIARQLKHYDQQMQQSREAASAQWVQAEEAMETIRHVESAETYALREAYQAYADAGLAAMTQSNRLEKEGKLKQPLFIAMENLFPETYGAHPDELKNLVENGRQRMAEQLRQRGMPEEQAQKEAKEHIAATFDTGHLNMWRKYWKGDEKKSLEENDQEFEKWMLEKVEMLASKGIIGHIHMVDNYGYQDDHLAPGEGNTPIKKIVEILKKHDFKGEMIVEPGADWSTDVSGFHSVMKAWRLFGSPVYGTGGGITPGKRNWSDVGYGFFGQNLPPYFVFGAYAPSEDWTLWSGVPLE